ncbi:hypothetical protein ABID82_002768 [Methylobacterium sp. PvP062]|uniref:Uncharacterized protein n=1 Tax=Methylobacterium radiotolerans TaxID=31998 RepID=A0ABV2NJM2_9HYPH|nr:hypothetical protein [Methylobacterium sp. PvP105]MBP2503569.1 hypothetical protein [Methylobacterium sp. PvP109]SEF82943.1 hypothetical protein SAMN04488144_105203 [Methylobacterium sp. 190mf]
MGVRPARGNAVPALLNRRDQPVEALLRMRATA